MARTSRRLTLVLLSLLAGTLSAQQWAAAPPPVFNGEFYFARLAYPGGGRRGRGSFLTDYPEAEVHLLGGISRLTRIDVGGDIIIELDDDNIMNYPWLYAVEVGSWYLDDRNAALIREYLLRGGFLMVDDFHGTRQWASFVDSMNRVFPDRPIVEIEESDPLMSLAYDLNKDIQIPGIQVLRSGRTYEQDGYTPYWRGIYDDEDRLMVAINFNMDLGDAWEHADTPSYPEPMTALAYRFAINYVIYSLTH